MPRLDQASRLVEQDGRSQTGPDPSVHEIDTSPFFLRTGGPQIQTMVQIVAST
jgi:hypothetical protein